MRRSFLFLQGPHGPFFRLLGSSLKTDGHQISRVNFNGGDALDWGLADAVSFREKPEHWPCFLAEHLRRSSVTDLVLYGDCRPLHEAAVKAAKKHGIKIHVFEEGYIRPDWITLEEGGVNGNSSLSQDPEWYLERANRLPNLIRIQATGNSTRAMMEYCAAYYAAKAAARLYFPHYRTHRPCSEWDEIPRWIPKLLWAKSQNKRDLKFQEAFLNSDRPFFLFGLQLGSDYQILRHSPFSNMQEVIVEVLTSFAEHAASNINLLVKNHPMDIRLVDLEGFTSVTAQRLGIADRVFFTQGGSLPRYIKGAEGVVVVNSTLGMSSLHHKRPTIALGQAIYNLPGLTHHGSLDSFWNDPTPPDDRLYAAFRMFHLHRTQINGSFYSKKGIQLAVPVAKDHLAGRRRVFLAPDLRSTYFLQHYQSAG